MYRRIVNENVKKNHDYGELTKKLIEKKRGESRRLNHGNLKFMGSFLKVEWTNQMREVFVVFILDG